MITAQEIAAQLNKPAKDLAKWNFPLCEVLHDYQLLIESGSVNLSESGLIVQNSTNIYGRRVDYLYADVSSTIETSSNNEDGSGQEKKKRLSRKTVFNFDDFESINFEEESNRNIHLNPLKEIQPMKLLNRRFPQLESGANDATNNTALNSMEIFDTSGDSIGRKYNYQCTQYLAANLALAEDLTPADFETPIEVETLPEEPVRDCDSPLSVPETSSQCNYNLNSSLCESVTSSLRSNDTGYASMYSTSLSISTPARSVLETSDVENDLIERNLSCSTPFDDHPNSEPNENDFHDPLENFEEVEEDLLETNNNSEDTQNHVLDKELQKKILKQIQNDNEQKKNEEENVNSTVVEETKVPQEEKNIRRSKRLKAPLNEPNNNSPSKHWEPIPFDKGVPDKLPRARREFHLPCHISLLKSKTYRKRGKQKSKKVAKTQSLVEVDNEIESHNRKITMYSPTMKSCSPMKKEEVDDFHKTLLNDTLFKEKSGLESFRYEAANNVTMDLLGFKSSPTKEDPVNDSLHFEPPSDPESDSPTEERNNLVSPILRRYSSEYRRSTDSGLHEGSENDGCSNYLDLDEENITDMSDEEAEELSEIDKNTAKWFEKMRLVSLQKEKRPVFNIFEYERKITERLEKEKTKNTEIQHLIGDNEISEIHNFFLASLHLANKYQVNITSEDGVCKLSLPESSATSPETKRKRKPNTPIPVPCSSPVKRQC